MRYTAKYDGHGVTMNDTQLSDDGPQGCDRYIHPPEAYTLHTQLEVITPAQQQDLIAHYFADFY
jgi:hypothetical protein